MKSDKSRLNGVDTEVTKSIQKHGAGANANPRDNEYGWALHRAAVDKSEADIPHPGAKVSNPAVAIQKKPAVPEILMEGDEPSAPVAGGPGQRYALGPSLPPGESDGARSPQELPEAYGTRKLLLTARDPHWLHAHWDLTREQRQKYNALSTDKHLVLRIFLDGAGEEPLSAVDLHPESTHWFVPVPRSDAKYVAELGYHQPGGQWTVISTSGVAVTPASSMSEDASALFATVPLQVPLAQLNKVAKMAVAKRGTQTGETQPPETLAGKKPSKGLPGGTFARFPTMPREMLSAWLAELARLGLRDGFPHTEVMSPAVWNDQIISDAEAGRWTPELERALAAMIGVGRVQRGGSLEISLGASKRFQQEISSMAVAQYSKAAPSPGDLSSLSNPSAEKARQPGFWFNVNAELIIHGATEPDAEVTIGGRVIKLRPDGTFSYRFALPDGDYELPTVAVSADKTDGRGAELKFSRSTEYRGEVGAEAPDPQLKPPTAEGVS